MISHL